MYNVSLRRVSATTVAMVKQYELLINSGSVVVVLSTLCLCHTIIWPVRLYSNFQHYLIKDTIFGKKLLNTKHVLRFSLQLCLTHFSF
jgi:hypothetical protein